MKEWKYLIGSADDFIGAPEWATVLSKSDVGPLVWDEKDSVKDGLRYQWLYQNAEHGYYSAITGEKPITEIIAQRAESFGNAIDLEFCKANPDHPDCKCKGGFLNDAFEKARGDIASTIADVMSSNYETFIINIDDRPSKYSRPCKGITLDVYDVLQAFAVTNPATQHAIKKLLCAGLRGHKDKMQDLTEALKSIERAIELEKE